MKSDRVLIRLAFWEGLLSAGLVIASVALLIQPGGMISRLADQILEPGFALDKRIGYQVPALLVPLGILLSFLICFGALFSPTVLAFLIRAMTKYEEPSTLS